jgi:hypothetical protein
MEELWRRLEMVTVIEKKSPFYPDQPVPVELFVGRKSELNRITERGMGQVKQGKSVSFFVRGNYGIGKSSLARYLAWEAEAQHDIFPIYAQLAGCKSLDDVAVAILQATIDTELYNPKRWKEHLGKFLGDFIGEAEIMGFGYNFEKLRRKAPELVSHHGLLSFLRAIHSRLKQNKFCGIFLILDEINGITSNPDFAQFLKGLWDTNAIQKEEAQVPILMMLCGVEQRRIELINAHEPVNRIFDVVDIDSLSMDERLVFFRRTFDSVFLKYEDEAIERMAVWSSGFPKIMHLIGDTIYWLHTDGDVITSTEASYGIKAACEIIGRKYFEPNVLHALQSNDYISILKKVADILNKSWRTVFTRMELKSTLSPKEERKLDNFLSRMKKIHAIIPTGIQGEYRIINNMIFMYIVLKFSTAN